jgi:hypothetical protein
VNIYMEAPMNRVIRPEKKGRHVDFLDDFEQFFGPPPLLKGEDGKAFEMLKQRLFEAVKPEDFIEAIAVNDLLNLVWESMRLRRLRAKLLAASDHLGLKDLIGPLNTSGRSPGLMTQDWALNGRKATGDLATIMKAANIDRDAIQAQTLATHLEIYEAIDRMIERADARRIVILRELDRHREALSRRLKDAVAEIEDPEFKVVEPPLPETAQ